MVLNCKLCGRESNITIEEGSKKCYNGENGGLQVLKIDFKRNNMEYFSANGFI